MKIITFSFLFSLLLFGCENSSIKTDKNENTLASTEKQLTETEETVVINNVEHYIKKIGSGEPILVLHGGPGMFHNYLLPHFKKLAQNYQIIFYDQRGCGKTAFPKDTSSINIETYVEDLEQIRSYLKIEKLNLLGHSWGAYLALKYGIKYPEHLKNLILVSPAPANSDYFDQTFANMQKKRSEEDTKALVHAMMSKEFEVREEKTFKKTILLGDKVNLYDQSKIEELYEPMTFTKDIANNMLIVNSLLERAFFNFDISKEGIDKIKCPSIILIGDMDNVPFGSAQSIQDNIDNCQLKVFKKVGHYPFFEAPHKFNFEINQFLNSEHDS